MSGVAKIRQKSRRRVTGSDVARLAGVSKSAVSRAYTGGLVSEESRRRIFEAAAELRYRPSHSARALTTRRSNLIGIAVTYLDNQFYPEVIQTFSDRLAELGYRILLFVTHGNTGLDPTLDEILAFGVDGVILASSSLATESALECEAVGVPAVMFNSVDLSGRAKSVGGANRLGARTAASFLLEGEHRNFGVISGLDESSTSLERCSAFSETILAAGLPAPKTVSGHFKFEGAIQATRELLTAKAPIDAIFCANDHMALAAIQIARGEFGRLVGQDLSIVGFDNVGIAEWPAFRLTSYEQPVRAMVECVIDHLIGRINGGTFDSLPVLVEGELFVRESSRPVSGTIIGADGRRIWRPRQALSA